MGSVKQNNHDKQYCQCNERYCAIALNVSLHG